MDMPKGKVIITVAVNGAFATKDMNPAVPYTPEEVAKDAYECYQEGAAIIHIHGRKEDGTPTGSKEFFAETLDLIRAKSDIVTNATTGGGHNLTIEERVRCLDAMPDIASLNMGTLLRTIGAGAGTVWVNKPEDIEAWAIRMKELGIKPEMECYSQAMFADVESLIEKDLLEPPYLVNFVMGMKYQGAISATADNLISMKQLMPQEAIFNVTAVGAAQLPLTTLGMLIGGNARVGLEDNIYYERGRLAKSNAELVARAVRIARELNLEPCTPAEAREILGLRKR